MMGTIGDNQAAKLREINAALDVIDGRKHLLGEQAATLYREIRDLTGVRPKALRIARAEEKRSRDRKAQDAETH